MYLTDKMLLSMLEINIYVTSQFGMHPNLDWDSHPNLEFWMRIA
jgi:hypothetical protein